MEAEWHQGTVEGNGMNNEERKGLQQQDMNRRKKMVALVIVIIVVAVIAIAYMTVLSRSSATVTLLVTHYDPQYADPARIALYIDDTLKEEFSVNLGSNYTVLFKLGHGDHTIGFDYTVAPSAEPDGVIDSEYSIEITTSDSREYRWNAGSSGLLEVW
jgi:hypothetical protein